MAGGIEENWGVVEMINMVTWTSCIVNVTMDKTRSGHTGDGDLVCGGYHNEWILNSCYNLVTGTTINLNYERSEHVSWSSGEEIYLLGGFDSDNVATEPELITGDTTHPTFELQHEIS